MTEHSDDMTRAEFDRAVGAIRSESNIATIVPSKTDVDHAAEIRAEIRPHAEAVADICNRARAAGYHVQFNIGPDAMGRIRLLDVMVSKPL